MPHLYLQQSPVRVGGDVDTRPTALTTVNFRSVFVQALQGRSDTGGKQFLTDANVGHFPCG
jgi:hypothetical protein